MGDCIYCSKPAGFLRKKHKDCEEKHLAEKRLKEQKFQADKADIVSIAQAAAMGTKPLQSLKDRLAEVADTIDKSLGDRLIVQGWENAVEQSLSDNILSKEEESRLKDPWGR